MEHQEAYKENTQNDITEKDGENPTKKSEYPKKTLMQLLLKELQRKMVTSGTYNIWSLCEKRLHIVSRILQ